MKTSGIQAAAYMKALLQHQARGVKGMCLQTCRLAWGLPADQGSAIEEWRSIPMQHRHSDPMDAPVGAPHFWRVGRFGHVAIQAELEGFVYSTDLPRADAVGLVSITLPQRKWRATYLGWASSFQNRTLPLAGEAPKGVQR